MTPLKKRSRRFIFDGGFIPYVSSARRLQLAAREAAKLAKRGRPAAPIVIDGRHIASTFWGKSWCENLERYSDFENRLPRGRSYLRSGAVLDLSIAPGRVDALVSGTRLYKVTVDVAPVPMGQWRASARDLSGAIDSVVELLQGQLSTGVMTRLCQRGAGLFPTPQEIRFACTCPDAAAMCKHIAAVLYGIGARLDTEPTLLFTLRQVSEADLVARASNVSTLVKRTAGRTTPRRTLDEASLSEVFGIDIAPARRRRKRT